jgi:hypothetical protein
MKTELKLDALKGVAGAQARGRYIYRALETTARSALDRWTRITEKSALRFEGRTRLA